MLPPIDDAILQSNPRFAALHSTLAKQILNPNGSTKVHPAQKERDAVSEALKTSRLRSAKAQLLKSALRNLDLSPTSSSTTTTASKPSRQSQIQPPNKTQSQTQPPLPPDLLELILLLSSHLSSPAGLSPHQATLLRSTVPWSNLSTHLPQIATLLSTHLQTQALALCRIQTPSTNPSFLHRHIPKLLPSITELQNSIVQKRTNLADRRSRLTTNTTTLLTLHHLATHLVIRTLEQTTHGALSRHLKARSEYLSLKATQVLYEARGKREKGEKLVYTEEVRGALENYVRELRGGRERGRERAREAERVLWGYGVGRKEGEGGEEKQRVLREVARVYGELTREVKEVGRDVERLRGR
ncbi:hypothetical protein BKA65DRAFT_534797 [Rhexocercosporidium sp. MPI-PUGE-AT-0058]|nr:hypothetical protein BKA65DRAFT_534797 [Rhexocercosporidium sp. MPI-PUGE-AT-0058]